MPNTAENYLRDVLPALLARAREARAVAQSSRTIRRDQKNAFDEGRSEAYYEVVSHLVSQLKAFGLAGDEYGLPANLSPERELLG
jgi:hypothetical protein